MMRRVLVLVLAVVLTAGLTACGGGTSASETTKPVPSTSSWPESLTPSATDDVSSSPSSSSKPEPSSTSSSAKQSGDDQDWGDEEELRAQQKRARPAVKVSSTLAQDLTKHRKSSKAAWWKAISPSLSNNGRKQFKSSSPGRTKFTKVTGKARLLVTDTDMGKKYVSVAVPTEKGTYLFLTENTSSSKKPASWKVASVSQMEGGRS